MLEAALISAHLQHYLRIRLSNFFFFFFRNVINFILYRCCLYVRYIFKARYNRIKKYKINFVLVDELIKCFSFRSQKKFRHVIKQFNIYFFSINKIYELIENIFSFIDRGCPPTFFQKWDINPTSERIWWRESKEFT